MITITLERWNEVVEELVPLFWEHWMEVGQAKGKMVVDPDFLRVAEADRQGRVQLSVVRADGKVVGYHLGLIDTLGHYKTVRAMQGDMYYVAKSHRGPRVAIRLFEFAKQAAREAGCQITYEITKLAQDQTKLFLHCGYVPIETRFSCWLGD